MPGRVLITTITNMPPQILQHFNRMLLDPFYWMLSSVENIIIPLANKKIRPQDVRKRRIFDNLLKQFYEQYERKKIEKADYDAAFEEKAQKRPNIFANGETCRFTRMGREK